MANPQLWVIFFMKGKNIKLAGSHYEDHNYLLPVPQTEIDLNPKLTQNPGY